VPHFYELHKLFDQVAEETSELPDLIAERSTAPGEVPAGTPRMVVGGLTLTADPMTIRDGMEHVQALSTSVAAFGKSVRTGIDEAAAAGDADTADLLTEVSRGVDKQLRMVEAHLHAKN